MADANGADLTSLSRWYQQAGTPVVTVSTSYNASERTFTLTATQSTPTTTGQPDKLPVLVPLAVALLGPDGQELPLKLAGTGEELGTSTVLKLEEARHSWTFECVDVQPVPSVLRNFSAPVKLEVEGQTDADLLFLMAHDTDPFNRWEAGQRLSRKILLNLYHAAMDASKGDSVPQRCAGAGGVQADYVAAIKALLTDDVLDGSYKAMAITPPALTELVEAVPDADPVVMHDVRTFVVRALASQLRPELEAAVKANDSAPGEPYVFSAQHCARRNLKNKALAFLSSLEEPAVTEECLSRFRSATNMTDKMAALACLNDTPGAAREAAMAEFYTQYQDEPLVLLKWLALQTSSNVEGNVQRVQQLLEHPAFNITNPNSCYSTFLTFTRSPKNFHAADGSGYEFMADSVLKVDKINAQVASRMVSAFNSWKQYDTARQALMKAQLQRIVAAEGLSANVFEIASKAVEF